MPGYFLEVPVRAVGLVIVFDTRSFDRVQRLFATCCWNVSKMTNSMTECLIESYTQILCFDHVNFKYRVGMPLVKNVRSQLWFPTFMIKSCLAFLRMRG